MGHSNRENLDCQLTPLLQILTYRHGNQTHIDVFYISTTKSLYQLIFYHLKKIHCHVGYKASQFLFYKFHYGWVDKGVVLLILNLKIASSNPISLAIL